MCIVRNHHTFKGGGCFANIILKYALSILSSVFIISFSFQILAAILSGGHKEDVAYVTQMNYFDFETKTWRPVPSMASLKLEDEETFLCAEYAGNYLYVAARAGVIYRYHIVNNVWETLPRFESSLSYNQQINCLCSVNEYVYAISDTDPPQRYSSTQNKWQSGSTLPFLKEKRVYRDKLSNVAAVVMKSKIYVLHGCQGVKGGYVPTYKPAVFHCFDPQKNEWKQKASTSSPHFGSSLFVDNSKLYVAGGRVSFSSGDSAPVEVYSEENNNWAVVDQTHIPPNKLGAVEVEGKVYFIINKFPVDSGIRIPPGEVYHISLHEWETKGIAEIGDNVALCYMPVKRESLENKSSSEKKEASVKGKVGRQKRAEFR